jgi:isochorismate hydrolase
LGFAFVVVEDACAAMDAEAHQLTLERTFPRLAKVRKTDEVIAALG